MNGDKSDLKGNSPDDTMKKAKDKGSAVKTIGTVDQNIFAEHFGALQTVEVVLTAERIRHMKQRHSEDYDLFSLYGTVCISAPDLVITDERNEGTVYMVKRMDSTNLNVVLRLALATDKAGLKNSVMTFWRIRNRNLKKLIEKNKLLYKKE